MSEGLPLERIKELSDSQAPERFDKAGNPIMPVHMWDERFRQLVDSAIWWHCYKLRQNPPAGITADRAEITAYLAARRGAKAPATRQRVG